MPKTKTVRVIRLAEIERQWDVVPLRLFSATDPAVGRSENGDYYIRVAVGDWSLSRGSMTRTERYSYFQCDPEGTITEAPRGYARDYKPGRIPVEELHAAVAKYAGAVR